MQGVKEISRRRAAQTAHVLAMEQADISDTRFTWIELYKLYFDRIYEHEYKRNEYVERERAEMRLRKEVGVGALCGYHGEFDDKFVERVHRDLEAKYAKSKWPNKLLY